MLLLIILISVIVGLAALSALLLLFVRKGLNNDTSRFARAMVGFLALQFILGMTANLYSNIPTVMPWTVFHRIDPILAHSILATCLLILSIIFWANAVKENKHVKPSAIGCIGIAVACAGGMTFVLLGQNNLFSLVMALGFLGAFTSYCEVAFSTRQVRAR